MLASLWGDRRRRRRAVRIPGDPGSGEVGDETVEECAYESGVAGALRSVYGVTLGRLRLYLLVLGQAGTKFHVLLLQLLHLSM